MLACSLLLHLCGGFCCARVCVADVRIDELNKPENIIAGFAPELFGRPLDDEDVLRQEVIKKQGVTYYSW